MEEEGGASATRSTAGATSVTEVPASEAATEVRSMLCHYQLPCDCAPWQRLIAAPASSLMRRVCVLVWLVRSPAVDERCDGDGLEWGGA